MPGADFIDTNVWVYAHLEDPNDPRSEWAWDFIHYLDTPVISAQVVAEYFNVMRRNVDINRIFCCEECLLVW